MDTATRRTGTLPWLVILAALAAATLLIGLLAKGGAGAPAAVSATSGNPEAGPAATSDQAPAQSTTNQPAAPANTSPSSDPAVSSAPGDSIAPGQDGAADSSNQASPSLGQPFDPNSQPIGMLPSGGVAPDGSGEPLQGTHYGGAASCTGNPAPNTYLKFQGKSYGLFEVFCQDGLAKGKLQKAGTTDEIGIIHSGSVTVYQADDGSLFTLKEAEPNGTPGMWYHWVSVR